MFKIGTALAAVLVFQLAQAASLETIQKSGQIVIGVKDSSPPFSQLDVKTRALKGYDIDFALGIAKRLKVKPVFKTLESDDRIPWIKEGKADIVIADLARSAEREKEVAFSIGYFVTDTRILAKKGRFKSERDLAGSQIALTSASSSVKLMRKSFPETKLAEFEDKPEMLKAVLAGVVDGMLGDGPVMTATLAQIPAAQRSQFEVSDFALDTKTFGVAMPKSEKTLQTAVNNALVDMETSGEALAIFNNWFGPQSSQAMGRIFKISPSRN
ncbi:transporter substrate-binding domain-containing protein [Deefgea piscis]|uniref:transporter substrate-binding domain-containing protein n=1 Tax=Deefgea piscis TaxID=2739061 RepID=UPI001C820045|nr:transporter substrate-binding domain-containing protein [Deefgea piscis]QZA80499.1 transporter substrate-binding domain-containing protein [Deefgea piscis]